MRSLSGATSFSTYRADWAELHKWRIRNLLLFSIGPGFLTLIALGLLETLDTTTAWRIANGACAAYGVLVLWFAFASKADLSEDEQLQIRLGVFAIFTFLVTTASLTQVIAAAGLIPEYSPSTFYFGSVMILLVGVYQFFRAVLEGIMSNENE